MAETPLPSREDTLVAISRWVGREPEVAYDLHPDLRVILDAARGWSSGRLVDREAIEQRIRNAMTQEVDEWADVIVNAALFEGKAHREAG